MTRMFRRRHLSDESLFNCYVAERGGEGLDPPAAEHLIDCPGCHGRYRELAGFMDDAWVVADTETAAIFTPDRLQFQQQEIARRLELLGHSGRVLSFRSSAGEGVGQMARLDRFDRDDRQMAPTISRAAAGWIATAAAAGLFIGVGAGIFYDGRARGPAAVATTISQPASTEPIRAEAPPADPRDDDSMFFSELQSALERPRTSELVALDAMTPRAREISYRIR